MKKTRLVGVLIIMNSFLVNSQEGKLETGKESLKETSTKTSSTTETRTARRSSANDDTDLDMGLGQLIARGLVQLAAYVTYGVMVETPAEREGRMHDAEIANYPYEKPYHGSFIYTDLTNYRLSRLDIASSFVKESAHLNGVHSQLNFRFLKRLDLELGYLTLKEKRPTKMDSFELYTAMVNYHRVRTQKLALWYGLGAMHVGNDVNTTGVALGVGGEWYIQKPISLKASHTWAYINNNTVGTTSYLLTYHINNMQLITGYREFKIGVSRVNTFSLGVGISL